MKRYLGLILGLTLFAGCSDGDLVFENLNFDNVEIQKCDDNELYFKAKSNELLLVDFSYGRNSSVLDTLAPLNNAQRIQTTNQNKIYYRTYDANVSKNVICALLAPANPKVVSEYISIPGGTIVYTRTMTPTVNTNGVNVNYMYTINFENITLSNGSSDIRYAFLNYGSFIYDQTRLTFNFNTNFSNCDQILIGNTLNEIIHINLPQNFEFPKSNNTQNISLNNDNMITYFAFKDTFSVNDDNRCAFPDVPLKEEWVANNGTLQIESTVVTNAAGNITAYKHQIKLLQTKFNNDATSFVIAEKIIGNYTTQP